MTTPRTERRVAIARVLTAYAAASVAAGMPWPLLIVLVREQHGGAMLVGLAAAARLLPYVLLSWAAGALGDRCRRERLVRVTLVLRLILLLGCGVAVAQGAVVPAVVAASLAVAAGTPTYPALVASLPGLAGPDARTATQALVTVEVSAWVLGPALGGLLLVPAARGLTLPAAIVLAAVSVVVAHGLRLPQTRGSTPASGRTRIPAAVVRALVVVGLMNLGFGAGELVLLPLAHLWGVGDAGFGMATAWLGFGALAAPLVWRLGQAAGVVVVAGALAVVVLTPAPVVALPFLALAGACAVAVEGRSTETMQVGVPDHQRAGLIGIADTVMVGSALLGALAGPLLAQALGARGALAVVAAVCVLPVVPTVAARMPGRRREMPLNDTPEPAFSR